MLASSATSPRADSSAAQSLAAADMAPDPVICAPRPALYITPITTTTSTSTDGSRENRNGASSVTPAAANGDMGAQPVRKRGRPRSKSLAALEPGMKKKIDIQPTIIGANKATLPTPLYRSIAPLPATASTSEGSLNTLNTSNSSTILPPLSLSRSWSGGGAYCIDTRIYPSPPLSAGTELVSLPSLDTIQAAVDSNDTVATKSRIKTRRQRGRRQSDSALGATTTMVNSQNNFLHSSMETPATQCSVRFNGVDYRVGDGVVVAVSNADNSGKQLLGIIVGFFGHEHQKAEDRKMFVQWLMAGWAADCADRHVDRRFVFDRDSNHHYRLSPADIVYHCPVPLPLNRVVRRVSIKRQLAPICASKQAPPVKSTPTASDRELMAATTLLSVKRSL